LVQSEMIQNRFIDVLSSKTTSEGVIFLLEYYSLNFYNACIVLIDSFSVNGLNPDDL